jgi:2-polyprenyl-6-methoxyphenol hydroxylase-like FAD-dependent oxidoreductase
VDALRQDVEEQADGVLLRFEDGSTVKARCVLAADGVHSGGWRL